MLDQIRKVYMVGIKGVGMTSLSLVYQKLGIDVKGSDVDEEFATDEILKKNGISVDSGFGADRITDNIDLVVTSGAHGNYNNEQVVEAKRKGIVVKTHAEALGDLSKHFKRTVAVCGTHGKTTTSSLAAFAWMKLGVACGYQVGVSDFSGLDGGGYTGDDYFIVEADEYIQAPGFVEEARFLTLDPHIAICTNIEYDHPDAYKNQEDVENAFTKLFHKMESISGSMLVYCYDDQNLRRIAKTLTLKAISYGISEGADFQLRGNSVYLYGDHLIDLDLQIPGKHNALNACAVVALAQYCGLDISKVAQALSQFTGSARRMQTIYTSEKATLIDDYAHHPTEIRATLQAVREKYPDKKAIMLFQPHTYSRTKALEGDFIQALSLADTAYLLDIFASAREQKPDDVSSELLAKKAQERGFNNVLYTSFDTIYEGIESKLSGNDIIITTGAGDLHKLHNGIIKVIT